MGLDDITHAVKPPVDETSAIITIHISKSGQVKVTFPEEKMTINDCAKIMYTATTIVLNNIKEREAIKKADPKVLAKLKSADNIKQAEITGTKRHSNKKTRGSKNSR